MLSINLQPPFSVYAVWGALGILAAIFLGAAGTIPRSLAHEFEDGHVERSVSFVVSDRKVFVEYAVGCNANTMTTLLTRWQADGQGNVKLVQPTSPATAGTTQTARKPKQINSKMDKAKSSLAEHNSKNLLAKEVDGPNPGPRPLTEQELEIEAAFRTAVLAEIARQLQITCNGERTAITPVSVELSPRHHVNALARLEFELPMAPKIQLTVHDLVFHDNFGAVKYALKPKRSAMLLRSNVAPILVRAERIDLTDLSQKIRAEKTTIDCELSFLSKNENGQ